MQPNLTYLNSKTDRLGDYLESVLREQDINYFLTEIKNAFPNFIAGVITDNNGFPIGSRIDKIQIQEDDLALFAIAGRRAFIEDSGYIKVWRNLDKSKNIKLFLLLQKSNKYIHRFKDLNKILETQGLF